MQDTRINGVGIAAKPTETEFVITEFYMVATGVVSRSKFKGIVSRAYKDTNNGVGIIVIDAYG